ncbi:helix-turn-helix transcriptional regulator [Devosia sp. UYZn731]|uniref:helix-turn-helix domain-containing protein n=1 Tax=Devosia sp. UYZn731 TaxID=3156345 RepID=UPI003391D439
MSTPPSTSSILSCSCTGPTVATGTTPAAPNSRGASIPKETTAFGSGNVFADLGVPNPEEHLAKSRLVSKISAVIRDRGLAQAEAAGLTGISQPKISGFMRGQFCDFSSDRLRRVSDKRRCGKRQCVPAVERDLTRCWMKQ